MPLLAEPQVVLVVVVVVTVSVHISVCVCVSRVTCSGAHQQQQSVTDGSRPAMTVDSLSDTLPHLASDDDSSLAVYTDQIDFGKFREDGSFIGQYRGH